MCPLIISESRYQIQADARKGMYEDRRKARRFAKRCQEAGRSIQKMAGKAQLTLVTSKDKSTNTIGTNNQFYLYQL